MACSRIQDKDKPCPSPSTLPSSLPEDGGKDAGPKRDVNSPEIHLTSFDVRPVLTLVLGIPSVGLDFGVIRRDYGSFFRAVVGVDGGGGSLGNKAEGALGVHASLLNAWSTGRSNSVYLGFEANMTRALTMTKNLEVTLPSTAIFLGPSMVYYRQENKERPLLTLSAGIMNGIDGGLSSFAVRAGVCVW